MSNNISGSVSLIITTYNKPDYLTLCISSLFNQSVLPGEVIIADDGSTDETAEVIESLAEQCPVPIVHVWQPDEGFRAGRSRNLAVAAATGEYLIMIDGDLVMHHRYIEDHLHYRQKGFVVQGGRIMLDSEKTQGCIDTGRVNINFFSKGIKDRIKTLRLRPLSSLLCKPLFARKKDQYRVAGGLMSCWKEDYLRINGYDHNFVGWGFEDNEFMIRMHFAGIRKRRIRMSCITYHLHHIENPRDRKEVHMTKVAEALSNRRNRCDDGIEQLRDSVREHIRFSSRNRRWAGI